MAVAGDVEPRAALRRARRLEYRTLGYDALEAVVSIGAGIAAGSTARIGFGADSLIGSTSGAARGCRIGGLEERETRRRGDEWRIR